MDKSFRIRTDVGKDKVVHVNLQQDYSFLEILSLKLNQIDSYKLHTSNYGIIIGRVLANSNFGIPNVKVSVFVPLSEDDSLLSEVKNLYPYESTSSKDSDGRKYNLLKDSSDDECYRVIGSFPNKRLVLDNDTYIEVFDKYYKYTTVTNNSGDYMIPFVPCGTQEVHSDLDLSDIGILSQKPIDLMYKGYNETQFDNAKQFKEGTNLNNLAQVISQNNSVQVYPFWGDSSVGEIAITRCDIEIQYKFEPTCVFFGSIVSDVANNNIGHKCSPSKYSGFNRHLVTGEGTIEMIRKTPDNLIEEYQIQGNRLIDGDGVWCYQIPMNLDYVGTDEFGNIVPTDNPNKGIPTRTSVRFRVSMQETGNEGVSRHRAKYLIPNVQDIIVESGENSNQQPFIKNASQFDKCYEFGSATPDEYFRDLYWNKVYSVKNYIPRIQTENGKNTQLYSSIKSVNRNENLNPLPFNHARYKLVFEYRLLCMIMTIVAYIISIINIIISAVACVCIPLPFVKNFCPFKPILPPCIGINGGLTEDVNSKDEYFPGCAKCGEMECEKPGCNKVSSTKELINVVQRTLSENYDTVNFDFYNDWLNGCLYLPLWFWRKTKKKKYFFGLFSKKAVNSYCGCYKHFSKLKITQNCSLEFDSNYNYNGNDKDKKYHFHFPKKVHTVFGVIKEFTNKAGLNIYYYAPGIPNDSKYKTGFDKGEDKSSYVRLYSTDIILLGSLNSCDLDNYPSVFSNLPSTTANIPFISTIKQSTEPEESSDFTENPNDYKGFSEITGIDWGSNPHDDKPKYGSGLFIDLACNDVYTKPKSCVNVERISELGVTYDMYTEDYYSKNNKLETNIILADGMITRYEIVDHETRAMFASLNNNGFKEKIYNPNTGYETYKLRYIYPNDFDGHLNKLAKSYTSMMDFKTYDHRNQDYIDYKFGLNTYKGPDKIPFYSSYGTNRYSFPLFNNSFYFYFGLNEGKTAIDKFNNKFNSVCVKNEKYPFTFTFETTPSAWCVDRGEEGLDDYATLIVSFSTIKTPYTYTLYNEFDEELISEEGISKEILKFGYEIVDGEYTEKKDGRLRYINVEEGEEPFVKNANDEYIFLENGLYTLEIIDANGNKGTQKIVIEQVPISLSYETIALGNKYYADGENKSVASDFCNSNEFYGEIRINYIIIDGIDYKIINCNGGGNHFDLTVQNENGVIKNVTLDFTPTETPELTLQECTCNGVNGIQYAKIVNNVLIFNVWIPQNYDIEVTEVCDTNPIPNTTKITVSLLNGEPFNIYINETPLRLIVGKNEEPIRYNPKLYTNGVPHTDINKLIGFWNNIHDEATYDTIMKKVNVENKDIWSDFTTVTTELDENSKGDTYQVLTDESKYNIIKYKFQSMFNLCQTCYVVDEGDSFMGLTCSGGKTPYLKSGVYPMYDNVEIDDDEIKTYLYDRDGYVACDTYHPNIIGFNYTTLHHTSNDYEYGHDYNESQRYPRKVINANSFSGNTKFDFNKLIDKKQYKEQGNYFAAFTKNGGYPEIGELNPEPEDYCYQVKNKKYQQYPYSATPHIEDILICPSGSTPDEEGVVSVVRNVEKKTRPYFRGMFIDKRLDYSAFIITPYAGNDIESIGKIDTWKKGSIFCEFYNGIAMKYDPNNYHIIGKGLEYEYDENYNIKWDSSLSDKMFYSAKLKLDNKSTDIRKDIKYIGDAYYGGKEKYPIIRTYENKEVKPCNKITLELSNCAYTVDLNAEDDKEIKKIVGITEGVGDTSFEIDCRDMINPLLPSLEECAANNQYNCRFSEYVGGKMYSNKFKLHFKVKGDNYNTTHSIYSYIPYLLKVKERGNPDNYLNLLKSLPINGNTQNEINNNIKAFKLFLDIIKLGTFKATSDTDDDITTEGWIPNIGRFIGNKVLFPNSVKHWRLHEEGDNTIVFDNHTTMKNVEYKCDINVEKLDVICISLFRNYLNVSGDNLTKEISTFQVTSIYDVRPFIFECTEEKIVVLENTETENTVTNSTTDADGKTDTTTSTQTGTGKTMVQFTQYKISWEVGNIDLNQQFINSDKMTAVFKADNKITSNINITSDETSATFDVYWNGDLEDTFVLLEKRCKLFIQMPNKLIYMIEFNHAPGKKISGV